MAAGEFRTYCSQVILNVTSSLPLTVCPVAQEIVGNLVVISQALFSVGGRQKNMRHSVRIVLLYSIVIVNHNRALITALAPIIWVGTSPAL